MPDGRSLSDQPEPRCDRCGGEPDMFTEGEYVCDSCDDAKTQATAAPVDRLRVIERDEGDERALMMALEGLDGMVTALRGGGHEDVAIVKAAINDLEQRLAGAVESALHVLVQAATDDEGILDATKLANLVLTRLRHHPVGGQ